MKKAKENRKKILDFLYKERGRETIWVLFNELKNNLNLSDFDIKQELKYLCSKGLVKFPGNVSIYDEVFSHIHISDEGIDFVENPEEYGKLFSINLEANSFGDVNNSNINMNSPNSKQFLEINQNELTPEVLKILKELKKAIEDKNEKKKESLLKKIKSGSENVFWSLVANGITAVVQSQITE